MILLTTILCWSDIVWYLCTASDMWPVISLTILTLCPTWKRCVTHILCREWLVKKPFRPVFLRIDPTTDHTLLIPKGAWTIPALGFWNVQCLQVQTTLFLPLIGNRSMYFSTIFIGYLPLLWGRGGIPACTILHSFFKSLRPPLLVFMLVSSLYMRHLNPYHLFLMSTETEHHCKTFLKYNVHPLPYVLNSLPKCATLYFSSFLRVSSPKIFCCHNWSLYSRQFWP